MIKSVYQRMSAVQILSVTSVTLCLLVDSIMIGRFIGVDAMSAYGIANPLLIIFTALGAMLANGVQVGIASAMGKGDRQQCSGIFSTSVVTSLVLAAFWLILIFAAANPLCSLLGAQPGTDIFKMTADYLRGFIIGAPFYFLSQIMLPYMQIMGKRKLSTMSVVATAVTDVVLDVLSITVFHAGLFGIGLASSLSYLAAFLTGIAFFLKKGHPFRFKLKSVNFKIVKGIVFKGSPILVNQAFFTIRTYVLNLILLSVSGTIAVAAYSVVNTVGNIFFSIGLGAGGVAMMLGSIFYSEEDRSSIFELVRVMLKMPMLLIIGIVVITEFFAKWVIVLFLGSAPEVLQIAVPGLRIFIASCIPMVANGIFKNYFQGIGKMKYTNLIAFFENVAFPIGFSLVLCNIIGLTGAWIAAVLGEIFSLLVICILAWKNNGKVAFSAQAFSMLDRNFGASPENVFEASAFDTDSVIAASKEILQFCEQKNRSQREAMLNSLVVEELAMNILKHGFTNDSRQHVIQIRLVLDEEKSLVRIRDNCVLFDPTSYMDFHEGSDPTEHIGIRLVMKAADEVSYTNLLGLNNLYIRTRLKKNKEAAVAEGGV